MQDLIVSISENILKISTVENGEFKGVSADISTDVVSEHEILHVDEFTTAMRDLIATVTKKSHRSLGLNFVIEPHDVYLKFITVNKTSGNLEDQLVAETRDKVKELPLEEMYFSYLKIAPFVYQFIGIKKSNLEKYIEVSDKLGIGLRTVFPWILFLPKIVNTNEPAIFLSRLANRQVVALSEFNGVFFSGVYEKDKSTEELQKLVTELSIYKRSNPISKVYVYNSKDFSLNPEYEVLNIEIPNSDLEEAKGYELHLLLNHMMAQDSALVYSKINLLTHLPVPVIKEKKNLKPVYIGGGILAVLLAGFIGYSLLNGRTVEDSTQQPPQDVLTSTENEAPVVEEPPVVEEEPAVELNKEDISIRVENGAGISGIAGNTQSFLEEAGYTITGIGNAAESGRTTTLIKIKADKKDYQDLLKEDMKDAFTVEVEEDLDAEEEHDVLIIVGSDADL